MTAHSSVMDKSNVRQLLRPKSVAVIGATEREGALGQRLLTAVSSGSYGGAIYPINPKYESLQGFRCFGDLKELPEVPDLIALAVADSDAPKVLEQAANIGVPAAIIFGRGYAPHGEVSPTDRLRDIAKSAGMAVCGNNCMGFVNVVDGLKVSGNPPAISYAAGSVGLVSHSGSTWSALVGNQRGLAFNFAVSAGQEIATTMADYVDFLIDQPSTRAIGCVMETLRDPEGFLRGADRAAKADIPLVVLKLGRSEMGRHFALAHSGALSGSDAVYRAVMEDRNIISVRSLDEFANTLELVSMKRRPTADGVGIVTDSGGERQLIVDTGADVGVTFSTLSPTTQKDLEGILDPGMSPENPVDCYGDGRMLLGDCLATVARDDAVGIVALATNLVGGRKYADVAASAISDVAKSTSKPVILFGNLESALSAAHAKQLRSEGIPVLVGTAHALSAVRSYCAWSARRGDVKARPGRVKTDQRIMEIIQQGTGQALSAPQAASLLDAAGLRMTRNGFAKSEPEARALAEEIGYPLVMKTANPAILHKTEMGGVKLGIANAVEAVAAYKAITASCGPDVELQEQVEMHVELILGMTNDPDFGPAVTVGIGGIFTELIADARTFMAPVSPEQALGQLQQLKAFKLLTGYRGKPAVDLQKLCEFIARFSEFCWAYGSNFSEIDLNPIIAGPTETIAVDSLFVRAA